ncbi:MAG: efflux RND transporter periplasmic adaptor subunit [Gammaproteobacteria bacterium]
MKKLIIAFCMVLSISTAFGNEMPPIPVEVQQVTVGNLEDSLQAIGTLAAIQSVMIRPEIAGRIKAFHFTDGETVEAGRLLISLDDDVFAAEVKLAEAKQAEAELDFKRLDTLHQKGTGSTSERDHALAEVKSAEARLSLARARFEQTQIKAPFPGVMGIRQIAAGNYVQAGEYIVNIENLDELFVFFKVPEIYLSSLKEEAMVRAQTDAYPNESFTAKVVAIDPKVDPKARNVLIKATLSNTDHRLRPGMFVTLNLTLSTRENILLISESAIFADKNGKYVFVVKDGKAEKLKIKTGKRQQTVVEVLEGLSKEDRVIISGQARLQPGSPVAPIQK